MLKPVGLLLLVTTGCIEPDDDRLRIEGPPVIETEQYALLNLRAYRESSGELVDVTQDVTWQSSSWDIANVTATGTVLVTDIGFVDVSASLGDELRSNVTLHVETSKLQASP